MNATRAADLVGCVGHEVAPEADELTGLRRGPDQHAREEHRPDLVEPEREAGDDAEVATAAAQPPEEVGVLGVGRGHHPPVGSDDLGFHQVVAREPELALEPTAAAPEREARDARRRHAPAGHREAVLRGGRVELTPREATLRVRQLCLRIDLDPLHAAQVDAHAGVDDRRAGDAVAAAVHRQGQVLLPCEVHGCDHVVGRGTAGDEHRAAVDHPVEHRARLVVAVVARVEELTPEAGELERLGTGRRHGSPFRVGRAACEDLRTAGARSSHAASGIAPGSVSSSDGRNRADPGGG